MTEIQKGRADVALYCPRKNAEVLIIGKTCFFRTRNATCTGCLFDSDIIRMRLFWFLVQRIEQSCKVPEERAGRGS